MIAPGLPFGSGGTPFPNTMFSVTSDSDALIFATPAPSTSEFNLPRLCPRPCPRPAPEPKAPRLVPLPKPSPTPALIPSVMPPSLGKPAVGNPSDAVGNFAAVDSGCAVCWITEDELGTLICCPLGAAGAPVISDAAGAAVADDLAERATVVRRGVVSVCGTTLKSGTGVVTTAGFGITSRFAAWGGVTMKKLKSMVSCAFCG